MGRTSGGGGGGGGGGALTLISSQILAAPAPTVTFSAIPGTFNHLRFVIVAASSRASENDYVLFRVNADAGANYDYVEISTTNGTSVGADQTAGNIHAQAPALLIPAALATTHCPGLMVIDAPCYAQTSFNKIFQVSGGYVDDFQLTTDVSLGSALLLWRSTAAITEVVFQPASGPYFTTGSAFYAYGVT
jgi:hypothetical protein